MRLLLPVMSFDTEKHSGACKTQVERQVSARRKMNCVAPAGNDLVVLKLRF
jgi:hypothetical protein